MLLSTLLELLPNLLIKVIVFVFNVYHTYTILSMLGYLYCDRFVHLFYFLAVVPSFIDIPMLLLQLPIGCFESR